MGIRKNFLDCGIGQYAVWSQQKQVQHRNWNFI